MSLKYLREPRLKERRFNPKATIHIEKYVESFSAGRSRFVFHRSEFCSGIDQNQLPYSCAHMAFRPKVAAQLLEFLPKNCLAVFKQEPNLVFS